MHVWRKLVREENWVQNRQLEFKMVLGHLKVIGIQGNF